MEKKEQNDNMKNAYCIDSSSESLYGVEVNLDIRGRDSFHHFTMISYSSNLQTVCRFCFGMCITDVVFGLYEMYIIREVSVNAV